MTPPAFRATQANGVAPGVGVPMPLDPGRAEADGLATVEDNGVLVADARTATPEETSAAPAPVPQRTLDDLMAAFAERLPGEGPSPTEATDPGLIVPARPFFHRRWVIVVGAVLALAALAGSALFLSQRDRLPTSIKLSSKPVVYRFPAQAFGETTVQRTWVLTGKRGSKLTSTLIFENHGSKATAFAYQEVIPKSLAGNAAQVDFEPGPVVIQPDPVVEWTVLIPPNDSTKVTYAVDVAPDGLDPSRLDMWANDQATSVAMYTATTTTTTVPPPTTAPPPRRTRATSAPATAPPATEAPTTAAPTTKPSNRRGPPTR